MTGRQAGNLTPAEQAELRAHGLIASPRERWGHPSGAFYLERLPGGLEVERRQRSDRPTRRLRNRGPIKPTAKTINMKEYAA